MMYDMVYDISSFAMPSGEILWDEGAVAGADFEADSARTLVEASVAIPAAAALDGVRTNYGLEAELVPLRGERDVNFLILVGGEPKYVLRLANPAEDAAVVSFRTAALLHLERHAPHLPVPRVLPTKTGEHGFLWSGFGERRFGQVVGYLPGSPMLKGAWFEGAVPVSGPDCGRDFIGAG